MEWEKLLSSERDRSSKTNESSSLLRSPFDMDYERIIYSSSIRRLQDKTQVFPLQRNDFTRTRLTHSLEVASIGRSMGWQIADLIIKNKLNGYEFIDDREKIRYIPSIVEVASLVHDLGNPPFGHYGEDIIKKWFKDFFDKTPGINRDLSYEKFMGSTPINDNEKNDFLSFDGNAQTFRILTRLQFLNDKHGVNFTFASLASTVKYPRFSNSSYQKFGCLQSEKEVFEKVINLTGIHQNKHPLVLVVEAADDIAYLVADIEDGIKKNLIKFDDFYDKEKFLQLGFNDDVIQKVEEKNKYVKDSCVVESDLIKFQNLKVKIQSKLIIDCIKAFIDNYDVIMNGTDKKLLDLSEETKSICDYLFNIAKTKCYLSNEVLRLELIGEKVLTDLLDLFVPAVLNIKDRSKIKSKEDRLVNLVSKNFIYVQEKYSNNEEKNFEDLNDYQKIQIVVDFITGMTDSYAIDLHNELVSGNIQNIVR